MLKPTVNTFFNDRRLRPDAKAFCLQTGANFIESRRTDTYVLLLPLSETEIIRWWKRSEGTYEQMLAQAQEAIDTTTAPVADIPLHTQPPGSVQHINNAIRRQENVYWKDENHILHKVLLSRRQNNQFQVKLALDQRWHTATITQVFRAK